MDKKVKKELDKIMKHYKWNNIDDINWLNISIEQNLSEDFIREFHDKVDWFQISRFQKLSEGFIIKEFKDKGKIYWFNISIGQKLSEDFIRKFQDKVNWENISCFQDLSDEFIEEFKDKLDLDSMVGENKISKELYYKLNKVSYPECCFVK